MSSLSTELRDSAKVEDDIGAGESLSEEHILTIWDKFKMFNITHWRGMVCLFTPIILIPILLSFPPLIYISSILFILSSRFFSLGYYKIIPQGGLRIMLYWNKDLPYFQKYQWCAYALVLMVIFWVTECIPLPITSFLPVIIFPLSGIMNTATTCKCYINDTVIMFLASMILAYSVEQSGLHKRLALCAIRSIGYSHYRLLFAMSFITMFISMWITNTAATTMMIPIIFAVLKVFEDQNLLQIYNIQHDGEQVASDITTCYFCAVTFSSTIGGIGTIVGTATNLVFKGLYVKAYPEEPEHLSFPKFSVFAVPYMLVLELFVFFYLIVTYFGFLRPHSKAAKTSKIPISGMEAAKEAVDKDCKEMGTITFWEIMVIVLFSGAILLFFSRSPQIFTGWGDKIVDYYVVNNYKFIQDSAVAVFVAFLMFLLPSTLEFLDNFRAKSHDELTKGPVPSVLRWTEMNDVVAYSYMFLLGGGFALSEAAKKEYSDLNGRIGIILRSVDFLPNNMILLLIIFLTVFVTNFASNVAVCNVIVPIAMQLAEQINQNPLWYNIAAGFSSSYCFLLPVGTPGNLIVQSAAKIPTAKMIIAGAGPTVSTIIISWMSVCFWAPVIWPDLHRITNNTNVTATLIKNAS